MRISIRVVAVLRKYALAVLVVLLGSVQLVALWQLISPSVPLLQSKIAWLVLHTITTLLFAVVSGYWLGGRTSLQPNSLVMLIFAMAITMPGMGGIASVIALLVGNHVWLNRVALETDFLITENPSLPFTTPMARKATVPDSRGLVEQLRYSKDPDVLYQKVLSSKHVRNSISVGVFREAVTHSDERIRLTAYQILDRKVSDLNLEIQRLEAKAKSSEVDSPGVIWLQIANNYWELLTLEQGDAIARKQLLKKAENAAKQSVEIDPGNRNAWLVYGRVCLAGREFEEAEQAFKQALDLGMPNDKVIPYLAEVAFGKRQFKKVSQLLNSLDDAFKQYPPLKQIVEYWA